jgi:hypothetical protein
VSSHTPLPDRFLFKAINIILSKNSIIELDCHRVTCFFDAAICHFRPTDPCALSALRMVHRVITNCPDWDWDWDQEALFDLIDWEAYKSFIHI